MKNTNKLLAAFTIAGFLSATNLFSQPGPGGGWGPGSQYNRMYNPRTVETISGEVVKAEEVTSRGGMGRGVHLVVKTDGETLPVHLGMSHMQGMPGGMGGSGTGPGAGGSGSGSQPAKG